MNLNFVKKDDITLPEGENILTKSEYSKRLKPAIEEYKNRVDFSIENGLKGILKNIKIIENNTGIIITVEDLKILNDEQLEYLDNEDKNLSEQAIKILYDHGLFSNLGTFIRLHRIGLFTRINERVFIKNINYFEEEFGRRIKFYDIQNDYFLVNFLKYADLDNFNFLIDGIKKIDGYGIKGKQILQFQNYKDIESTKILSFISQPGLSKKIEKLHEINGKEFNIFKYFKLNINYRDISNIGDNFDSSYEKYLDECNNQNKKIEEFSNELNIFCDIFGKEKLTYNVFNSGVINKYIILNEKGINIEDSGFSFKSDLFKLLLYLKIEDLEFILDYYKNDIKNIKDINNVKSYFDRDKGYLVQPWDIDSPLYSGEIQSLFEKYEINFSYFSNEDFVYLIKYGININLDFLFQKYSIDDLLSNINIHHIKKLAHQGKISDMDYLFEELENNNQRIINNEIGKYVIFNTHKSESFCRTADNKNNHIFCLYNENYVLLNYKGKILGHLKTEGSKLFLSYKTIFDYNGRLCFLKGGMYYIDDYKNVFKEKNNNLENIGIIDMNLLRMHNIDNFDKLLHDSGFLDK